MDNDRFRQISLGDEAELKHIITEKDVADFARITGDDNPLHMDENFAAQTTLCRRVVHGMLTASFISTIIGSRLPGPGALWYEQNLRFLSPVRIGENVLVRARVKHKSESQRILVLTTTVLGEDGRTVIAGEGKVKVLSPQKKEEPIMNATNVDSQLGAVVITGGSRGIGAAIARRLAQAGYAVVINFVKSRSEAEALAVEIRTIGGRALPWQADVTDEKAVRDMVKGSVREFQVLNAVVNNAAGRIEIADFADLEWTLFTRQLDVQLKGAFNVCQAALPYLTVNPDGGAVVNIASIAADSLPPIRQTPYVVAKAALAQFSRCLAVEYGPKNIRVNAVSPGMTATNLIADFPEKAKMINKMQTPLRRLADPADIAGAVVFLISPEARHITGQNLRICGGLVMA